MVQIGIKYKLLNIRIFLVKQTIGEHFKLIKNLYLDGLFHNLSNILSAVKNVFGSEINYLLNTVF